MTELQNSGTDPTRRPLSYEEIEKVIQAHRTLGHRIVLTSGSYDLFHIGHARYLGAAKNAFGCPDRTVLVVGVDSDAKVRARKGKDRPIIPEEERAEILLHCRHVDYVVIKPAEQERWRLIKTVQPDLLVCSERNKFTPEDIEGMHEWCGEVRELRSQAATSTSAKIRQLVMGLTEDMRAQFRRLAGDITSKLEEFDRLLDKAGKREP